MAYCHKCGKKSGEGDSFCENCGARIEEFIGDVKEKIEDVGEEVKEIVEKPSRKGMVIFLIVLIVVGYVVLDLWATTQITPVLSFDSVVASASNFKGSSSLTSGSVSSSIRLKNPTFVPIIVGGVIYEAGYGSTKIAEGKTGVIVLAPYSEKDVPADLEVSYVAGGVSLLKGAWNTITGKDERKYVDVYANAWVTKFKIGELWE